MSDKIEKHREGIIILKEDTPEKMDVEGSENIDVSSYQVQSVIIYYQWCKKCGICVTFCPTGVLGRRMDGSPFVEHPEKCVHCGTCDRLCPDFAISGAVKK
jgi:NAD-dependent dihydropyrimidine dehydrogenase PreA subunit